MQLSIKTPPELTLPILEKCAEMGCPYPSSFASDCTLQCLKWMDAPHTAFQPMPIVEKYFHAIGREGLFLLRSNKKENAMLRQLVAADTIKRAKEAAKRLAEFQSKCKKQAPAKHLHLKISPGMTDLTRRIQEKAAWLHLSPNAFVVVCLRDCLEAMDDPKKAIVPPAIVVDFWTASHAKLRPKAGSAIDSMVQRSYETMLRERSVPILDTIVRLALNEQWDTPLQKILKDAGVLPSRK